jgi:F0F1-type ATP synthase assembly protein I
MPDPDRSNIRAGRDVSPWEVAGMGTQFVVALLLSVYAGNWVDTRFGTAPFVLLVAIMLGGGGTFILSYRRLMRKIESLEQHEAASVSPTSPVESEPRE